VKSLPSPGNTCLDRTTRRADMQTDIPLVRLDAGCGSLLL
jgi:hypothetical protein